MFIKRKTTRYALTNTRNICIKIDLYVIYNIAYARIHIILDVLNKPNRFQFRIDRHQFYLRKNLFVAWNRKQIKDNRNGKFGKEWCHSSANAWTSADWFSSLAAAAEEET